MVCSAVQGVTDLLQQIAETPGDESLQRQLILRHEEMTRDLGIADRWTAELSVKLNTASERIAESAAPRHIAELLALGEWASTRIGADYLNQSLVTDWVDATKILEVLPEPDISVRRQWLSAWCLPGRDDSTIARLNAGSEVVLTQGYIARMPGGGTALLGRGGSDVSAALIGGRIGAERVEIWTDVPGLFSSDPRLLPGARLLCRLDYTEALEMAASGARVIHPRSIRAAEAVDLPLWITDTSRPKLGGTRISASGGNGASGAKAVVCQPSMAVILMENVNARQHVGFLAKVFDVFARRGVSIDLVATSETTTTVALNMAVNHLTRRDLDSLEEALRDHCTSRVFDDCVCVNIVGMGIGSSFSRFHRTLEFFGSRPLLMVSQSANNMCLSLLVERGSEQQLVAAAHADLIESRGPTPDFGPSWAELEEQPEEQPDAVGQGG